MAENLNDKFKYKPEGAENSSTVTAAEAVWMMVLLGKCCFISGKLCIC